MLKNYLLRKQMILNQLFLYGVLFICGHLNAQNVNIQGKVVDTKGIPITGVNIYEIDNQSNGSISDYDGNFTLNVKSNESIIKFTFVGFLTQEITVKNNDFSKIVLKEDVTDLDEIVVIGYGVQKKSDLTGSVGNIDGKVVSERKTSQLSTALQGALSGVMVRRDGGSPDAKASIRVRGITSIGTNDPLIIVDGVPVDNINNIMSNDVANISVLKDAASASIYGARAAAGVILITTKRAKEGEMNINYSSEFGFVKPSRLPKTANAIRYMEMLNERHWNDTGNETNEFGVYEKDYIENYLSNNIKDPNHYPLTDWQNLIIKDYASRQSHTLRISGGSEKIKSSLSVIYDQSDALYKNYDYERISTRFNNDIKINKWISSTFDISFKRSKYNKPCINPMYKVRVTAPIYAAKWDDGRIAEGKQKDNVYGLLENGGIKNEWYNDIHGKFALNITPVKDLKISLIAAPSFSFSKIKDFKKAVTYTDCDNPNLVLGHLLGAEKTTLDEKRNDTQRLTKQLLINYSKNIHNHDFEFLVGYEDFYYKGEDLGASRKNYDLTNFPYLNLGSEDYQFNSGNAKELAYRSYLGRIGYNYKKKYLAQANIRYDASSRFHKDYRWGSFPSFSLGWVVSEEGFFPKNDLVSFLKLRASYGTLGNERIGSNYPYQSTIAYNDVLMYQNGKIVSVKTASQIKYAISDITWEKTKTFDIGFDSYLFDSRLRVVADYYRKYTSDMLLELEIPDFIGYENPDQNVGEMKTTGWDFEVCWTEKLNDFRYSVAFNISDFKSVIEELGGKEFLGNQVKFKGSEINEWYGYISEGIYQTQEEVDNSATLGKTVGPGDLKYRDISGPEGVPDGIISAEYDRVLLGGSLPHYIFGGNIDLGYKNFDLGIVIQGVGKQNVLKSSYMTKPFMEGWGNVPQIIDNHYWSKYNTEEQNQNASYPRLSEKNEAFNYATSDHWIFNGGYLRLKNIVLGYTLPKTLLSKVKLDNVRVYTSISDLFSIDNFPKGWDPEAQNTAYPITKSFIFGVNVKF